jgi:hypothetical protein
VGIAGGNYFQSDVVGKGDQLGKQPGIALAVVALQLDEETVRPKETGVAPGDLQSFARLSAC